jgi:ATP-binding cassette subfamily B protein
VTITTPPERATVDDDLGPTPPGQHPLPQAYLDEEPLTPYEPIGVTPNYLPPRGAINPDKSKGWIRRVWPIMRSYRFLLFSSIIAAVFSLFAMSAVPLVVAQAIDKALVAQNPVPLEPFVIALLVLGALRGLLSFVYRYGLYKMAYRVENDLRVTIYRHLTRLSFGFYDRIQSGQIISRANSDIRSMQMFLAFAPMIGISVLSFFVAMFFMLKISVELTLVSVVCLPGVYVLGWKLRTYIFPLSWIVQARTADIATIVDENINGVRVVKSFAQEQRQIRKLALRARRLQWANVSLEYTRANYTPIMENLPRIGLAIVLAFGGMLVINGELQIGVLVAFNSYILMMQTPFRLLGFFMMMQQRAAASADRIFELLDEKPEVVDKPDAIDLTDVAGRIEFRNVRFGYGEAGPDILDGFDLTVEPGETVAIVGRTGNGKSTVTRLLPRFYDVRDGQVLVDGHDVRDVSLLSLRAQIGMVLDDAFLFSTTARENIAYGRPDATMDEIITAAKAAQADEFITRLPNGYDSMIGERGYTLSGGQRQRIAIARTLLVNPRILVLDDATSAIDVKIESEIHGALEGLLANRTTIVIAHRLSTISLADRVVLIEGGRVVASGTHQDLMAHEPRYAEVLAHSDGNEVLDDDVPADEDDLRYRMRIAREMSGVRGGPGGGFSMPGVGGI